MYTFSSWFIQVLCIILCVQYLQQVPPLQYAEVDMSDKSEPAAPKKVWNVYIYFKFCV